MHTQNAVTGGRALKAVVRYPAIDHHWRTQLPSSDMNCLKLNKSNSWRDDGKSSTTKARRMRLSPVIFASQPK